MVPYSGARRATSDFLAVARRKHLVHAVVEVDVTRPRRLIRAHRDRTGESLSFTAFVAACLAKAVEADPSVQACRQGRRRLVLFDDVDVCVLVEHGDGGGGTVAAPHVIRRANRMPYLEVHRELRAAQAASAPRAMRLGGRLPGFAARWFWRLVQMRPAGPFPVPPRRMKAAPRALERLCSECTAEEPTHTGGIIPSAEV